MYEKVPIRTWNQICDGKTTSLIQQPSYNNSIFATHPRIRDLPLWLNVTGIRTTKTSFDIILYVTDIQTNIICTENSCFKISNM